MNWILANGRNWNETNGFKISRTVVYPQVGFHVEFNKEILTDNLNFQAKFKQISYENDFVLLEIFGSTRGMLPPTCISSEPLNINMTCKSEFLSSRPLLGKKKDFIWNS